MKRAVAFGLVLICSLLVFGCCAAEENGAAIDALLNASDGAECVIVRSAPSAQAESLGAYYSGIAVQMLEDLSNGWVRVRIGNVGIVEGYVKKECLQFETERQTASVAPTYKSLSSGWELYHTRDVNGDYTMYGYGHTVTLLGYTSEWWHIRVGEKTGFVSAGADSFEQLTGCYYAGYTIAQVNNPDPNDRLNLRVEKSVHSKSLGKYYNGCIVAVLDKGNDGWSKVRIGNLDGYMKNEFLDFDFPTEKRTEALPEVRVRNANGEGANLRRKAASSADIIALYPNGTKAQVLGVTETWYHVLIDGETGFILARYLDRQL